MDPVSAAALLGFAVAALAATRMAIALFPGRPRDLSVATPQTARYAMGVILWAFVCGQGVLAANALLLHAIVASPAEASILPAGVPLICGLLIVAGTTGVYRTWRTFDESVARDGLADVARLRGRAIARAALLEGVAVLGAAVLIVASFV